MAHYLYYCFFFPPLLLLLLLPRLPALSTSPNSIPFPTQIQQRARTYPSSATKNALVTLDERRPTNANATPTSMIRLHNSLSPTSSDLFGCRDRCLFTCLAPPRLSGLGAFRVSSPLGCLRLRLRRDLDLDLSLT
ncbi:hypothetical protein F5Y01DRAFT_282897 [Xylaria sp. FL0043]|nr:hypothetical protein F5Y01DRAFT_282897 [Xylaria sp. FL0043]